MMNTRRFSPLSAITLTDNDKVTLGALCTKDESGKHFTETHGAGWLADMEVAGYITINRPVHQATGIPYSQEYWNVQVDEQVSEWFDDAGNLI